MRTGGIVVAALLGALLLALTPAPADAQQATATARRLFRDGVRALESEDFAAAEEAFRRSYEIAARPPTLYNLGVAQAGVGKLVQASETYRRFIREATDERYATLRAEAERALAALEERMATLTIEVENLGDDDAVVLDDRRLSRAAIGAPMPTDPGQHVASVTRRGEEVAREELDLEEGAERTVVLQLPLPVAAAVSDGSASGEGRSSDASLSTPDPSAEEDDGGGLGGWAIFGIVAGVLAVAGGVVAAVLFATAEDEQPYGGSLGTFTIR